VDNNDLYRSDPAPPRCPSRKWHIHNLLQIVDLPGGAQYRAA